MAGRYPFLQTPVTEKLALLYVFATHTEPGAFLTPQVTQKLVFQQPAKGTFYNYFRSKEELASRLVDRQFEALHKSLSRTGQSASHQLKEHCSFLALEPPAIEVAPLQLLATLAAEATAIPIAVTQRIASGTNVWITHVGDLISLAQIEGAASTAQDAPKLASLLVTCWYGAIIRRKSDPSVKLLDDFLPFFIRSGIL